MALRDKLAERVAPHLEPGDELRQVFMAQSGPNPYWILLTWFTMFWNRYLIVVVTDRSLVTFRATAFRPSVIKKPLEIVRYDRTGALGPCSGLWGRIDLDGTKFYVHRRFHKDITAADAQVGPLPNQPVAAAVPQDATTPEVAPGWYPDPHQQDAQRYWDGNAWTDHTA